MGLIETLSAVLGLLGTLLLASRSRWAGWGFVAYLVSNGGWIAFAYAYGHWGLLVQQLGFTLTSAYGIWKWLVQPCWTEAKTDLDDMAGNWSGR